MGSFPWQKEIDVYYEDKKQEVGKWLLEFAGQQKRLTQTQKSQIQTYAEQVSFSMINEINDYIQNLKTVGKKNKEKFNDYILRIEWFPEGFSVGLLDGRIVNRIMPNELELLFGDRNEKQERK